MAAAGRSWGGSSGAKVTTLRAGEPHGQSPMAKQGEETEQEAGAGEGAGTGGHSKAAC